MPNPSPAIFLALWHRALAHEIGIAIETDDRRWLERHLYAARQGSGDPALMTLMMIKPPNPAEVWLVRKTVEMNDL